jgi:MFS family permease
VRSNCESVNVRHRLPFCSNVSFSLLFFFFFVFYVGFYSHVVWVLVLYLLCFAPGLGPVPWAISSEIFSVKVRGMGTSISTASNWLANFLISVTFPLFTDSIGYGNAFFGYCFLAVLSLLFVYLLLPETKGLTLEEIQVMLRENPYPRRLCGKQTVKVSV